MIFTEQEQLSRRQFHELFCTRYLYTGSRKGALNEDSWTADTLYDILRNAYTNNQLTPQDIETMLHIGGMFDANGDLFFHYREDTPMIKEILYAMSPFISTKAFIKCKQRLGGLTADSVASFVVRCCTNPDQGNEKMLIRDLYDYYTNWCAINDELSTSKKVFNRRLSEIGFRIKKGYVNGKSGVLYVMIKLDKEAAVRNAKPQRAQTEEAFRELAATIRDVDGTGAKVLEDLIETSTRSLPEDEGRQNPAAGLSGSDDEHEADVRVSEEHVMPDEVAGYDDDFDWGATYDDEDDDPEDGSDTPAKPAQARTGEIIIPVSVTTKEEAEAFIKTLPYNVRTAFKQMKITYRISPNNFELDEFEPVVRTLGIKDINVSELYRLFQLYAERAGGNHDV